MVENLFDKRSTANEFCSQAETTKDLEARAVKVEQEMDTARGVIGKAQRSRRAAEQALVKA